jgi:hypothetical protein
MVEIGKRTKIKNWIKKRLNIAIKRLFKCHPDNMLITVWREEVGEYAFGQKEYKTNINIGGYRVLAWRSFYTPIIGDDE